MRNDPLALPRTGRVTLPFLLAIASAATFLSAGSVALTRDTSSASAVQPRPPLAQAEPVAIEARIPRNVVAFARVTMNPVGPDAEALARLLKNVPSIDRTSALEMLDEQFAESLPISIDLGEIRATLGEQMAIALHVVDGTPQVVTILEARDVAKARTAVRQALARGHVVVADGTVLYAGAQRAIKSLRAAAAKASMATHATYLKELGALGGSGLAVGWFDGSRLAGVKDADLPAYLHPDAGSVGTAPDLRKSVAVGAAFIDGSTLVFEMRERGGLAGRFTEGSSQMPLFRGLPARTAFGMAFADPAGALRTAMGAIAAPQPRFGEGMDLERLLFSWLGDEVAMSMLPGTDSGVLAIAVKDEAAFERAFTTLRAFAEASGSASGDSRAFSMSMGDRAIEMRRGPGKVVVAMAETPAQAADLATSTLRGGGATLAGEADYRRLFGRGPAAMRFMVRTQDLSPLFGRDGFGFLRHIRAIGYEMRIEGSGTRSRVAVAFPG